jgi:alkaline phosphatase D
VRVAWSGDMVGQGWGIDESRGGLRIYDAIRRADPDVFVHSGDNVYADGPLAAEVPLDDGTVWRNLVTEAKHKVAETLDEFRGNFAYHLLDEHARRFHAEVPVVAQWDDHEVVNNWYHDLLLDDDPRYTERRVRVLAERGARALFEFLPIRPHPTEPRRVYRRFAYGPLLEIFVVDLRSYRGANSHNRQATRSDATAMLGDAQRAWLARALAASAATWKVIASDMPIGLVVPDRVRDGRSTYEAVANADPGVPLGRELELAALLAELQRTRVRNVVWITADVHYAAAHHYGPERAAFTTFDPFWEFVAGPMHAGTFGPNPLDATFGPEVRFASAAPRPNRPPSDGLQFFGTLDVDARTRALTAALHDVAGRRLWSIDLAPYGA